MGSGAGPSFAGVGSSEPLDSGVILCREFVVGWSAIQTVRALSPWSVEPGMLPSDRPAGERCPCRFEIQAIYLLVCAGGYKERAFIYDGNPQDFMNGSFGLSFGW